MDDTSLSPKIAVSTSPFLQRVDSEIDALDRDIGPDLRLNHLGILVLRELVKRQRVRDIKI